MSHPEETILYEYLDAALPGEKRSALEAHLANCQPCMARLHELSSLFVRLASPPDLPIHMDLSKKVLARLAGNQPVKRQTPKVRLNPRLSSPAAGVLVGLQTLLALVLLGVFLPVLVSSPVWLVLSAQMNWAAQALDDQLMLVWDQVIQFFTALPDLATVELPFYFLPASLVNAALSGITWIFASAAGLLWLVGNSLLLRRPADKGANKPR